MDNAELTRTIEQWVGESRAAGGLPPTDDAALISRLAEILRERPMPPEAEGLHPRDARTPGDVTADLDQFAALSAALRTDPADGRD